MTPVVPVYHPRREARRAVKQGYPRRLGTVRLCRSGEGVERLLQRHLVDAVVLDVKAAPDLAQALPARTGNAGLCWHPTRLTAIAVRHPPLAGRDHRTG